MTIKQAEEMTGLTRSNIRFYEKEKLIEPSRNGRNDYRDYSEGDIERLKKIAFLRTLEVSIEDIRSIISGQISLTKVLEKQNTLLQNQIENLNNAKTICEKILESGNVSFDELQAEKYVTDLQNYWQDSKDVFKLDSVSFLYIWGSFITWSIITALCLIISLWSYSKLPSEIPVQWNHETVSSLADKKFIFAYPAACVLIRIILRPFFYAKLAASNVWREIITEYLTNYTCFIALSMEVFSILFIYGAAKSIVTVLLIDTIVLIGLLAIGIAKTKGYIPSIKSN